jgi:hypothetical protein
MESKGSKMEIEKITYPCSALDALSEKQLSAFLLLGLFLNEMNWLQKIMLIASTDRSENEADKSGRLSLLIMISKIMAAKLNEGWNRINNQLKETLDALPANKKTKDLRSQLEQKLGKDSTVYKIRTHHTSHYPTKLSLKALPDISKEEIAIYTTSNLGDVLSAISDLSSLAELLKSTSGSTSVSKETLDKTLNEIYEATRIYCEYIGEILAIFVKDVIKDGRDSALIENDTAIDLNSIKLPFFMKI